MRFRRRTRGSTTSLVGDGFAVAEASSAAEPPAAHLRGEAPRAPQRLRRPRTPRPERVRTRVLLLVLLGGLLLAGCRLQLDVNVALEEDGSGSVEVVAGLDADALERVGGDLSAVLVTDDLTDAGWVVEDPVLEGDGFTRVRIRRTFADEVEAAAIFADIAGAQGPFQDFAVERDSSFARTKWRFDGRVDFRGGLGAFGDAGLAAELDGEPLGQSAEEIEEQLGESLSRLIQVRVGVRLPGEVTSNAAVKAQNGAVWQVGFGEGTVEMEAVGSERRTATLVAAGIGALCLLALLVYGLVRLAMRSTDKRAAEPEPDPAA